MLGQALDQSFAYNRRTVFIRWQGPDADPDLAEPAHGRRQDQRPDPRSRKLLARTGPGDAGEAHRRAPALRVSPTAAYNNSHVRCQTPDMAGLGVPRDLGSVPSCGAAAVAGTPAAPGRGSPARLPVPALAAVLLDLSEFGEQRGSVESLLHPSLARSRWRVGLRSCSGGGARRAPARSALSRGSCSPRSRSSTPRGRCALVAAYFGIAVAVGACSHGMSLTRGARRMTRSTFRPRLLKGTHVGLGAVAVTLLAAPAPATWELLRVSLAGGSGWSPRSWPADCIPAPVDAVRRLRVRESLGPPRSPQSSRPACRRPVRAVRLAGSATALFTAAAFSTTTFPYGRAYGAWIGVGFALALSSSGCELGGRTSKACPGLGSSLSSACCWWPASSSRGRSSATRPSRDRFRDAAFR